MQEQTPTLQVANADEIKPIQVWVVLGINAFVNRRLQIDFRAGRIYLLD